jgi:acetolactate decarboxylase
MSLPLTALFQFSTYNALNKAIFDGSFSYRDVIPYGDFGLGTYADLNGEMLLLDGQLWLLPGTGVATIADPDSRTPFAAVTTFKPTINLSLPSGLDYNGFATFLADQIPERNLPLALRVDGYFSSVHFRSLFAQTQPYPTLSEAAASGVQWEVQSVRGTMVGFRFPQYLGSVNLAGWHLHFITEDRKTGGHVLGFKTRDLNISAQYCPTVVVNLPTDSDLFAAADLN